MSIYIPAKEFDAKRARARLEWLIGHNRPFELTERRPRTLHANSYLHVILAYFASQHGDTADYVKRFYFKLHCNRELFVRTKHDALLGQEVAYLRSTTELTQEELTLAIDRFRNWAADEAGIYIPSGDEYINLLAMEQEIERNKEFI